MSKTDDATELPSTVVVRPDRDTVHRQGGDLEPACADRLHNTDADWRLTQESRTDPQNRCGHPECFRGEQPVADGAVAVPEKYQPEPRRYEDKAYLVEQYWGELKSVREIADENDTCHDVIRTQLVENGIPTRVDGYNSENSISPFAGFYDGTDKPGRTDEQSRTRYDPDYDAGHDSETSDDGAFRWGVVDSKGDRR